MNAIARTAILIAFIPLSLVLAIPLSAIGAFVFDDAVTWANVFERAPADGKYILGMAVGWYVFGARS